MHSLCLFACAVLAVVPTAAGPTSMLEIQTSSGCVDGFVDPAFPHVRQWSSVPYAQPPLGALRFAPPLPISKPAAQPIQAKHAPPNCMFWLSKLPTMNTALVTQFNPLPDMSEDCLYLNIYAPTTASAAHPVPVLIFIHGGQWIWGGIQTPYYRPENWVERAGDVIVVEVNFRQNVFGFPNARGLKDGERNVGFADIRLSMNWVRDNIAAFGGDPSRLVLWGQSAGAASVDMLQFGRYASDPIVQGVIVQSAAALLAVNANSDPDHHDFTYLAQNMGCPTATAEQELACMRSVDPTKMEHFLQNHTDSMASPTLNFVPATDNQTVFTVQQYVTMGAAGNFSKLPMIIGSTREEYAQLLPLPPGQPAPNLTTIYNETFFEFLCPEDATIQYRTQSQARTYRYIYGGNFTNISPEPWMGAYHFSDVPMVMGSHYLFRGNSTPSEYQTSHIMQDLWRTFANDPKNGLPRAGWPDVIQSGKSLAIALDPVGSASTASPITRLVTQIPNNNGKCPST